MNAVVFSLDQFYMKTFLILLHILVLLFVFFLMGGIDLCVLVGMIPQP